MDVTYNPTQQRTEIKINFIDAVRVDLKNLILTLVERVEKRSRKQEIRFYITRVDDHTTVVMQAEGVVYWSRMMKTFEKGLELLFELNYIFEELYGSDQ